MPDNSCAVPSPALPSSTRGPRGSERNFEKLSFVPVFISNNGWKKSPNYKAEVIFLHVLKAILCNSKALCKERSLSPGTTGKEGPGGGRCRQLVVSKPGPPTGWCWVRRLGRGGEKYGEFGTRNTWTPHMWAEAFWRPGWFCFYHLPEFSREPVR